MVLALPQFDACSDLVTQLILIGWRIDMPLHGLLRMAALLTVAENVEVGPLAEPIYRSAAALREAQDVPYHVMTFLAQFAPVRALQLIRHARHPDIRRWSDEWDGSRLMLAAHANARLWRMNKARELYALALKTHLHKDREAACRRALLALGS